MKVLMIYLKYVPTTKHFDSTMFGNLLNADIGYALDKNNNLLQDHFFEEMLKVYDFFIPVKVSTIFNENFCIKTENLISTNILLETGKIVSIENYEIILISHSWFYNWYIIFIRKKFPKKIIIGIQEEAVQDIISFTPALQSAHFKTLSLFDGYIAINKQFYNWAGNFVKNLIHLHLPLPIDQFNGIASKKKKLFACIGIVTWNTDFSNFYSNILVLNKLNKKGYELQGFIIGYQKWQKAYLKDYEKNFSNIHLIPECGDQLYDYLIEFKLAINLTLRAASGRISAEFAALGVPCIGNKHNDLQMFCWPKLSVSPYNIKKAIEIAEKLLSDDHFYDEVNSYSKNAVEILMDHSNTKKILYDFINNLENCD